jgi:3-isopropylmalate/(R)-2-methylmalate dehydratase small subunit
MEKIEKFSGVAVPLKRSNVDTDQIIPAVYLKRITKTGFEDALFASWKAEPDFVLNQPVFANGEVLIVGPDFGTGSSREHAVWALRDWGFKAVFSAKFADIFRGNSGKQGFVTGVITEDETKALWDLIDANPGVSATVDLPNQTLSFAEMTVSF